ncbi:MAG: ABC transporter permease [Patescibacteria group bacterium]|nr:ABC transporter permease [Patescibacteria group bacterium]
MKQSLYTVFVFAYVNTKRFFRNRVAIFFGLLFPLIILFVLGGIFGNAGNNISFNIALINESQSPIAAQMSTNLASVSVFKINTKITTLSDAQVQMANGTLDAAVVLPASFGQTAAGSSTPSGAAVIYYPYTNAQEAQALESVIQAALQPLNGQFVTTAMPFGVSVQETGTQGLTSFDYTFAGLLGFALLGIGIFGPVNIFPELKKQGVLRRLETTPLKVWQYFVATALSQCAVGLLTIAAMFLCAILIFHLQVVGNYFELFVYLILSIITMLGIGLAVGGWAKDQSQAAPLSNIIVFPMMFLSGTFFPRFLMPGWLQGISTYFPLTPIIDGLRMIATQGKHLTDIGPQLGLLLVWTVVIYVIAFRVFRWS